MATYKLSNDNVVIYKALFSLAYWPLVTKQTLLFGELLLFCKGYSWSILSPTKRVG